MGILFYKLTAVVLLFTAFIFNSCSKDTGCEKEEIVTPLILSPNHIKIDYPCTMKDSIIVSKGNDGYKVIKPKQILINGKYEKYSDDLIQVVLKGNKVYVTQVFEGCISVFYLVIDNKQQKRIFLAETMTYDLTFTNVGEIEKKLLNDDNYWDY